MTDTRLGVCLVGAGRIGRVHARNIAAHPAAELRYVVDIDRNAARSMADEYGCSTGDDAATAIARSDVDAVLVASPSSTHHLHVAQALDRRKPVFVEKPFDTDVSRARQLAGIAAQRGVPVFVAFNRRFDRHHRRLYERLRAGEIGKVEIVAITSRDPEPPRPDALMKEPGALFKETMIHDLDTARWLLGEEPILVSAFASNLIEPAFAPLGEVDTAVAILRTASGKLVRIDNSWRATYGFDQRIEVLGEKGMLRSENVPASTIRSFGADGGHEEPSLRFFLDRYADSYAAGLDAFVRAIRGGTPMPVDAEDGWRALALADTALQSARTARTLPVPQA